MEQSKNSATKEKEKVPYKKWNKKVGWTIAGYIDNKIKKDDNNKNN